jgi:methyl-accepting chemotaxis protein
MGWLYNLSVKAKVLFLTLLMILLMLIVAVLAIKKMGELDAADTRLYEKEAMGITHIKEATIDLLSAGRAMRNYLLSQQDSRLDAQHHYDAVIRFQKKMEEEVAKAEPLFYTEAGKAKLQELKSQMRLYEQHQQTVLSEAKKEFDTGRVISSQRNSYYHLSTEVRPIADNIDHLIHELSEQKEQNAKKTADDNTALYHASVVMLLVIVGIAILSGIVMGLMIANRMSRNAKSIVTSVTMMSDETQRTIRQVNEMVLALAEGDLSKRMAFHPIVLPSVDLDRDEIGTATHALTVMSNQVNDNFSQMQKHFNESFTRAQQALNTVSHLLENFKQGNFRVTVNDNAPGAFGMMLTNAYIAAHSIDQVMSDINQVMAKMSEGDFGSRVNAQAQGELLTMKENINVSLSTMAHAIQAIGDVVLAQAKGDLTKDLPNGAFKGQLHDLKNAINYSSKRVKESVIQAIDASNIVNEAAIQVSQGSSDLSGRVQEQAAALEETSATMNEMAAAVQTNTQNAKKVSELAHQVQHQAGAGVDVMQQTISAMQSIKESSSKIADIVTLIDGIAFQTNLLALNAAVEAARAGEHGRGFAVVAGEVRALAQKSAEAAKDIKDLIGDSVNRIEAGTQLADKSGEMLSGITGSIEQVAVMIEEIANASAEQTQGISQVHRAIADIDKVTQENAALVEETTAAAESLSTEANHLKENMSFFKTGVTSHAHYQAKPTSKPMKQSSKGLPSPASAGSGEWSHF